MSANQITELRAERKANLGEQISVEKEALKQCLLTEMGKNADDYESRFLNLIFVSVALNFFSVFLFFTSKSPNNYELLVECFWIQFWTLVVVSGIFMTAIFAARYPGQEIVDFDKHFSDLYVHVC